METDYLAIAYHSVINVDTSDTYTDEEGLTSEHTCERILHLIIVYKGKEIEVNMGTHFSLPEEDLIELVNHTSFKKEDVKRWYRKFMKDYPDGQLNKEQFNKLYTKIYSSTFANRFADIIFRSFDHNHDGVVSFKELMLTLSLTTTGEI